MRNENDVHVIDREIVLLLGDLSAKLHTLGSFGGSVAYWNLFNTLQGAREALSMASEIRETNS